MRLRLDESLLVRRAEVTLVSGGLRPPPEPLFDPAIALPLLAPLPVGFPALRNLLTMVPNPYGENLYHAYTQMMWFASAIWPAMGGLVDAQPAFEWIMHNDVFKPWYRDHIVHQVRVATIGDLLLGQRVDGRMLLDRVVEVLEPRLRTVTAFLPDFVRLAWWTTGLFHDSMYLYENHGDQWRKLREACRLPSASPTSTEWFQAHGAIADLVRGLTREDILRCQEAKHAFASSAEMAMQNENYQSTIGQSERGEYRARRRLLFALACEAIISHHHLRVADRKISFVENPLGFLLVLSDELHEANRPLAKTVANHARGEAVTTFSPGDVEAVSVRDATRSGSRTLSIKYHLRAGSTDVRGKTPAEWCEGKQETLSRLLDLGSGLFDGIVVTAA